MHKIILFFIFNVLFFPSAFSVIITKIKGYKALINLEGTVAEKGDHFEALNLYGKPVGLLEIKKIKRGKAIAVLLKGKMETNWILESIENPNKKRFVSTKKSYRTQQYSKNIQPYYSPRRNNNKRENNRYRDDYSPRRNNNKRENNRYRDDYGSYSSNQHITNSAKFTNGLGVLIGMHKNSITISEQETISGWRHVGMLSLDILLADPLYARIFVGYQELLVQGKNCSIQICNLFVQYPGVGSILRAVFFKKYIMQPWFGVGGFFLWPIVHKEANLGLSQKSFSGLHGVVTIASGIDIHFKNLYIPIQLDLNWINLLLMSINSNTKEFTPFYFGIKAGVAFIF